MTHSTSIAVVTGANRGLGLETCRQLACRGISVILTSRARDRGEAAAAQLRSEGLEVRFQVLDVTDASAVRALSTYLQSEFGRLDILVNNAGIFTDPYDPADPGPASVFNADLDTIRRALETNTFGALRLAQALIPLMNRRGNVVNVSSGMGQLSDMNGCCPGYRLSKTALNAVTRILADELRDTAIKVNSVCPGWVKTDMGGAGAERSVQEGAAGIVWAACLPVDGPSGGFFRDGKPIPW
ncbi:MAG: SDR family oxidoreductase [Gammaproteobacteria bacterium]|nr:MAG: SDR family oxidoreductase [Gammaproteobacteria bacterium]